MLSKINIRSSWSRFEHFSESLIYPLGSVRSTLILPPIYHFGPDFALFIDIFQYLALFTYLSTFSLIFPYLAIFTLNCPNLTICAIFTIHIYSSSRLHLCFCKILKQSENESWRITHLAHRKSYLVIICPNSHEKLTKN